MPRQQFNNPGLDSLSKFANKDTPGSDGYPGRFDSWEAKHGRGGFEKEAKMLQAKNKVEKFKIDPELKKMVKQYQGLTKMSGKLKEGIMVKKNQLEQMAKILYGTEQIRDQVLSRMNPRERVMDQPEEEMDLQINY